MPTPNDEPRHDPKAYLARARKLGYLDDASVRVAASAYASDPTRRVEEVCRDLGLIDNAGLRDLDVDLGRHVAVGPYDLLSCLGRGGMGVVYRARHRDRDHEVALKIPHPAVLATREAVEQHKTEISLLERLNHDNIVRFLEAAEIGETHYIAMEFADGPTLREEIRLHGPLDERRVVELVRQIASAMIHYDSRGFVHRDLKPANIILSAGDQVRILDLGLARRAYQRDDEGRPAGTPHYMSPEQVRPETGAEALSDTYIQTDLYSLGATMYHMLTGSPPYGGASSREILKGHLSSPIPDGRLVLPSTSPYTWEIVEQLLAKDCSDRYSHPAELLEDCDSWLEGKPPRRARAKREVEAIDTTSSSPRHALRRAGLILGGLVLAVGCVAAYQVLTKGGGNRPEASQLAGLGDQTPEPGVSPPLEESSDAIESSGDQTSGDPTPGGTGMDSKSPAGGKDESSTESRIESATATPRASETASATHTEISTEQKAASDAGSTSTEAVEVSDKERDQIRAVLTSALRSVEHAVESDLRGTLESRFLADLRHASRFATTLRERLKGARATAPLFFEERSFVLDRLLPDGRVKLVGLSGERIVAASQLGWHRVVQAAGLDTDTLTGESREGLACLYLVTGDAERAEELIQRAEPTARAERLRLLPLLSEEAKELRARFALEQLGRLANKEVHAEQEATARQVEALTSELFGPLAGSQLVSQQRADVVATSARWSRADTSDLTDLFVAPAGPTHDGRVELLYTFPRTAVDDWLLGTTWALTDDGLQPKATTRSDKAAWSRASFTPLHWKLQVEYRDTKRPSRLTVIAGNVRVLLDAKSQEVHLYDGDALDETNAQLISTAKVPPTLLTQQDRLLSVERLGAQVQVYIERDGAPRELLLDESIPNPGGAWRAGIHLNNRLSTLCSVRIVAGVDRRWANRTRARNEHEKRRLQAIRRGDRIGALFPGVKQARVDSRDPTRIQLAYDFDSAHEFLDWETTSDSRQTNWVHDDNGGLLLTRPLSVGRPERPRGFYFAVAGLNARFAELQEFEYRVQVPAGGPCAVGHFVRGELGPWNQSQHTWLSRNYPGLSTQIARGPNSTLSTPQRNEYALPESEKKLAVQHAEKRKGREIHITTRVSGRKVLEAVEDATAGGDWVGIAAVGTCIRVTDVILAGRLEQTWLDAAWLRLLTHDYIDSIVTAGKAFDALIPHDLTHWNLHGGAWSLSKNGEKVVSRAWEAANDARDLDAVTYAPWARLLEAWGSAWIEATFTLKRGKAKCGFVVAHRSVLDPFVYVGIDEKKQLFASVMQGSGSDTKVIQELARAEAPPAARKSGAVWKLETDGTHCRLRVKDETVLQFDLPEDLPREHTSVGFVNSAGGANLAIDNVRIGPGDDATQRDQ